MKPYFAVGAAALVLAFAGASRAAEITWAKSYKEALKAGKDSGKLVMVDFTADWCVFCKKLDKETYSDPKVAAFANDKLVSVKVDTETEEGKKLQEKFNITGLPTIYFFDGDGKVQGKVEGFKAAGPFLAKLETLNKAFKEMPAMLAKIKEKPGDAKTAAELTLIYIDRGEMKEAEKILAAAIKAGGDAKELAKAHNAIGDGYQEAEHFDEAIKEFKQAAESGAPKDKVYALSSIGACYMSLGRMKEALAEVEKSLAVEGASDDDKQEAQALHNQLKQITAAAEKQAAAREKAAKEFPGLLAAWTKDNKNADAGLKLAKAYVERGEAKKAQEILKTLEAGGLDLKKVGGVYFEIAQALMRAGDADTGEAILKRLSTDGNADERAKALVMMGLSKARKQDIPGAIDLVDKAVKIEGVSPDTLKQAEQLRKALQNVMDQIKKQKEGDKTGG